MKKKAYYSPETETISNMSFNVWAGSGGEGLYSGGSGIEYGGEDDGTIEPDAKEQVHWGNLWASNL